MKSMIPFGTGLFSHDVDRLFDGFFGRVASPALRGPRVQLDLQETDDAYTVVAEVPGVERDDLEITFADDVKTDISLRKAGPYPGKVRGDMLTTVNALRTRGMTAFYDACCEGARALQLVQGRIDCPVPGLSVKNPRWLVALTDGADNRSSRESIAECIKTIKNTPNLNVALITVGNEIDLRVCQQFLDAAIDAGNIGLMIQANNVEEISNAFAVVAQAMAGGIVEVL